MYRPAMHSKLSYLVAVCDEAKGIVLAQLFSQEVHSAAHQLNLPALHAARLVHHCHKRHVGGLGYLRGGFQGDHHLAAATAAAATMRSPSLSTVQLLNAKRCLAGCSKQRKQ
jgi:hypothetical protein